MQGHPESSRLLEKHADGILRNIGLTPTVHKPCLYSGFIKKHCVILMRQVDDFAIACQDEQTAHMLLDIINDHLSIPLKRQGLIDMFNGIDVTQTRDYIKIDCHTYMNKFCEKCIYLAPQHAHHRVKTTTTPIMPSLAQEIQLCSQLPQSKGSTSPC